MSIQTETRLPEFDLLTLGTVEDPYPLFAELRAASPLIKSGWGQWGVTRHAEVAALLRDRRVGHELTREMIEFAMGTGPSADFQQHSLLNRDGADHTRLRRLMGQAFSAPLVRKLRDHIGDMADDLLEPLMDGGDHDIVDVLAFPLPSMVICELLGLPGDDRDEVRRRTSQLNNQDRAAADAVIVWFREYIGGVLAERQPDPEGDLLQRMLAAEDGDDALTHEEIVDNAVLLFFAGFETTKNVIASGCAALFAFPEQQQRLWADPTMAASAVEEFLRYDAPLRVVPRVTLEPIEVGPRVVKAGRVLQLMLGSANHDERVFAEPDRVDITRTPNPHVAFAGGVHHCLGAMLARVEGDVVFRKLAERLRSFEPAGPPVRSVGGLGTYASVPVRACAA